MLPGTLMSKIDTGHREPDAMPTSMFWDGPGDTERNRQLIAILWVVAPPCLDGVVTILAVV